MSAKAIYGVTVTFGIIRWEGEWDNQEEQMEEQLSVLVQSKSKEYARAAFQRISKSEKQLSGRLNPKRSETNHAR